MRKAIQRRYIREESRAELGCANIMPFIDLSGVNCCLDVGCGRGSFVRALADRAAKSCRIFGLDITSQIISIAQKEMNPLNVFFTDGDMHEMPYDDCFFDMVFSNCVINHSLHKDLVFKEIHRVLKNGGRLLMSDVVALERIPDQIRNNPDLVAECWAGAEEKGKYLRIINEQGFIEVQQLISRLYRKNGYLMESIIIEGVKS